MVAHAGERHEPDAALEHRKEAFGGGGGQPRLTGAAKAEDGDEPLRAGELVPQQVEFGLATYKTARVGGKIRRPDRLGPQRREVAWTAVVVHQQPEPLGRREVLQPMLTDVHQFEARAEQRTRGGGDDDLAAVSGGRHARREMHLQAAIAGRGATDEARVDTHPHAQLPDRLGPRVAVQRPLRGDRGLDRGARVDEVREQRVALAAVDMAARPLDRIHHQLVVLGQHPRPQRTGRARQPRRALDVGEQHRHNALWRLLGIDRPVDFERGVVAQDRLLQALQLRRGL